MTRKFYKTIVRIEVLSEDGEAACDISDLPALYDNITTGPWSGRILKPQVTELTGKQAARALQRQGSDPEFFHLDEAGNDLEEFDDPSFCHVCMCDADVVGRCRQCGTEFCATCGTLNPPICKNCKPDDSGGTYTVGFCPTHGRHEPDGPCPDCKAQA